MKRRRPDATPTDSVEPSATRHEDNKKLNAASAYIDALTAAQEERLGALQHDKEFKFETASLTQAIIDLEKREPVLVKRFFREFTYLSIFRPHKLENLLRTFEHGEAIALFRRYAKYALRFQVRLVRRKGLLHPCPVVHCKAKHHARIVRDHLAPSSAGKREPEPVFEDFYHDDAVVVPSKVADFLAAEKAKFVQIDDSAGSSVLTELEAFGYESDQLTFLVHRAPHQSYLFCLVGENVATDKSWRNAGKVITALQKHIYGRAKPGRPSNIPRMEKAIRLAHEDGRAQDQAFDLLEHPKDNPLAKLETPLRFMRQIKRKLKSNQNRSAR